MGKGDDALQRLSPVEKYFRSPSSYSPLLAAANAPPLHCPAANSTKLGVVAGLVEVALLQPMLYCKNATQQGIPLEFKPSLLYRGFGVSCTNMMVLTGLQFPLTAAVTQLITGGVKREMSAGEKIAAALGGGALSGVACAPMELTMVQQQKFGIRLLATPGKIIAAQGGSPLGMFRGLLMSCGREGVFTCGYLGIGPAMIT